MTRFVTISGCSGGGKSTLLDELARRGHAVVAEPGRRIVQEELAGDGAALPWVDGVAFARRAMALALKDQLASSARQGVVFFDRGLVDAAAALEHLTGEPALTTIPPAHSLNRKVFMAPPWPEIFVSDAERRHGLDAAAAEYERLLAAYAARAHEVVILPKIPVADRVDFILERL